MLCEENRNQLGYFLCVLHFVVVSGLRVNTYWRCKKTNRANIDHGGRVAQLPMTYLRLGFHIQSSSGKECYYRKDGREACGMEVVK